MDGLLRPLITKGGFGPERVADGLWRVIDEVTTLKEGFTIGADGRVTPSGPRDNALLDYYHEIDHVAHPELDQAADSDALSDLISPGSNGVSGAADVSEALGKGLPAVPDALLGSVGLMVGGVQVFHGLNEGDAQKTASGLNQFGGSAFSLLDDKLLGKALGAVGGGASIGSGIISISEGEPLKGALDLGAGAALVGASLCTGPGAPICLALAAGFTAGSIAYDLAHASDPAPIDQPKVIDGQPLFL